MLVPEPVSELLTGVCRVAPVLRVVSDLLCGVPLPGLSGSAGAGRGAVHVPYVVSLPFSPLFASGGALSHVIFNSSFNQNLKISLILSRTLSIKL